MKRKYISYFLYDVLTYFQRYRKIRKWYGGISEIVSRYFFVLFFLTSMIRINLVSLDSNYCCCFKTMYVIHIYSFFFNFFWGSLTSGDKQLLEIVNDSENSSDEITSESRNIGESHKASVSNLFLVFLFHFLYLISFLDLK